MEKNFFKLYSNSQKEENNLKIMYSDLINSQDEKIENAILSERNRISRDIHDSLGHLTSRGILQIGAMIVTEKDENKKEQLVELKNTLSDGMNEVRNSLHNFQNESIDLEAELTNMVNSFDFCSINFFYSVSSDLSLKEKYSIIYIVKESLTNIVKHSDADRAEINIIESKAKIYIKIFDNGNTVKNSSDGMGVFSIKKRVEELKGNIEISTENGYRMFISFDI
ncbi:two-component sensor histidine kinase [Peptostreptococcus russellii]|uniref:sensor histidine kinase n=1 Tax=Peptostreptococcus russellii TaxID=215200 RepID=UPI001626883D|nr:histidine kinase [Peptostreptococcus russellii]MBC2578025.1 two-component sensor histidine kinase [Peptostreptococcus russellii]